MARGPLWPLFAGVPLIPLSVSAAAASAPAAPSPGAFTPPAILGQVASAWSSGQPVASVQITGTATWHAGSLEDTGSATLTATSAGAAQMQLSLSKKGEMSESVQPFGITRTCQFSGSDGVPHTEQTANCWKAAVWFLPAIALQPAAIPMGLAVTDLGAATGASGPGRHVQGSLSFQALPATLNRRLSQESATDIAFDPQTLLAQSIAYTVHPDDGPQGVNVPVLIQFSDYRKVQGVEIPFLIQRYVNGSLQLEIAVNTAQVN